MQYNDRPKRGRGLTIVSISLVIIVLGCMIAVVLYPGDSRQAAPTAPVASELTPKPAISTPQAQQPAVDLTGNPFVKIAQEAGPSVVSISNKIRWFVDQSGSLGDMVQSSGSGVIISEDGYVITNQHVIEGAEIVTVIMADGEEYDAQVIGEDATSDIAVIKIDKNGLTPAKIGSSSGVQVGEFVVAIGSPLGNQLFGSVTLGIISATNRMLDLSDSSRIELLQTDAAINPGNSGGALYNIRGELIGINTIKYSYTSSGISTEGLSFAIPIDNALPIVEELIAYGKISRPALGIRLTMIDSYSAGRANVPVGVLVRKVYAGSPAEKAGIQEDDIITHIDGIRINVFADLTTALNSRAFGETTVLTVYREGKELACSAVLEPFENPSE